MGEELLLEHPDAATEPAVIAGSILFVFNGNQNGSSCNDHAGAADASGVLSGLQFFCGPSKTTDND